MADYEFGKAGIMTEAQILYIFQMFVIKYVCYYTKIIVWIYVTQQALSKAIQPHQSSCATPSCRDLFTLVSVASFQSNLHNAHIKVML